MKKVFKIKECYSYITNLMETGAIIEKYLNATDYKDGDIKISEEDLKNLVKINNTISEIFLKEEQDV